MKYELNKIEIQTEEFTFNYDTYKDDASIEDEVFIDNSITSLQNTSHLNAWKPEIPFENVKQT